MKELIKKSTAALTLFALVLGVVGIVPAPAAAQAVVWDVSGTFVLQMEFNGVDYPHTLNLSQDEEGNLTGSGSSGAYAWTVTSGSVDGDTFQIDAEYTATTDAEGTVLTLDGTIAADGSISGTWSDNYQGGERVGSFETEAGAAEATELPETVDVTIVKYVDGEMATAEAVGGDSFQMNASWDADNIGSGSGTYTLAADSDTPYTAVTTQMSALASYSTSEVLNDQVDDSCDAGRPYALLGYSVGNTLEEAEDAEIVDEVSLTGLTSDKYVIVWNDDCATEDEEDETVTVTIVKYVDGEVATDESTGGDSFQMNASWNAANIGSGSGTYTLAADSDTAYTAVTTELSALADYSTSEVLNDQTGESCDADTEYALIGYLVGDSLEEAEDAEIVDEVSFTDLSEDKYVIVLNDLCATEDDDGTIGGDVEGDGELEVTSIETIDGTAVANGEYEDGWEYVFHITVPTDETSVAMKFGNWTQDGDGNDTIPAANNIRISSEQADNDGATVSVTAVDTYTSPALNITEDLDATEDGLQIEVRVEVRVPEGTDSGSYTTTYGVRSE